MRAASAIALVLAISCGGVASAATINAVNVIEHVNAVIYGSATTQADIEGQAIIGGSYSGASMYNNPPATPYAGYGALTVYGATSGNPININNGGSAYVGGAKGEIINFNGGGHYLSSAPDTITDFASALNAYSTALSSLTANSTLPSAGNNEIILAHPDARGVAVFNLTTAQLAAIPSYSINLNGASTVLFNVSGASLTFNANEQFANQNAFLADTGAVIWNFYQATSLTFGTQIAGTVLAPHAAVTNNNQIDGALVAASWSGHGELHDNLFHGVNPIATPEPGTWAMMLIGVAGVGAGLRRQRRRAAATA